MLQLWGQSLSGSVKTLTVTAKSVSDNGFSYWNVLETVNLVNVKTIGELAFYNCKNLETVDMPALTTGAKYVFANCHKLETVTLGAGLTAIPDYMFSCDSTVDRYYEQYYLTSLKTINLNEVQTIGAKAFNGCEVLENISLASAKTIGDSAFQDCKAMRVELGNNVTSIGDSAFSGCKEWNGVFGNRVKTIGQYAFSGCSVTGDLNLPETITQIGYNAFGSNNAITAVKFAGTVAQWEKITNGGFINSAVEYYCNNEKITSYTPSGDAPNNVFAYNQSLTTVNLTNAKEIGNSAFKGCANLENVTGMTNIKKIGGYAFNGCVKFKGDNGVLKLNEGLTHLYAYAFSGCSDITDVTIPESVIYLGNYVFKDCSVNKLWISSSITKTEDYYYVGLQAETITVKVKKDYSSSNIAFENGTYEITKNVKTLKLTGTPQGGCRTGVK